MKESELNQEQLAPEPAQTEIKSTVSRNTTLRNSPMLNSADTVRATGSALHLMAVGLDQFNELMENLPKASPSNSEETKLWLDSIQVATTALLDGRVFDPALSRESDWQQGLVDANERPIVPARPSVNQDAVGLTGESAVMRLRSLLGAGGVINIPLYDSGIWLGIKPPSNTELLELDRRIANEKVTLGRQTKGLIYSHVGVYVQRFVTDMVLNNIYTTNLVNWTPELIRKLMLDTDQRLLAYGVLCAIYPNGYPLEQPCVANAEKCSHIEHLTVSIPKLLWVDNSRFNPEQRSFLRKRLTKVTETEVLAYQKRGERTRTVAINDQVSLVLSVPTVEQSTLDGIAWVDGIEQLVDNSFAVDLKGKTRDAYISQHSRIVALRQYGGWIQSIVTVVGETEDVITDRDTIASFCDELSAEEEYNVLVLDAIADFIAEVTNVMLAVPTYNCPSCQTPQTDEESLHPRLIPLDIMSIFFILTRQRLTAKLVAQ